MPIIYSVVARGSCVLAGMKIRDDDAGAHVQSSAHSLAIMVLLLDQCCQKLVQMIPRCHIHTTGVYICDDDDDDADISSTPS